jgi:hypothetical protein
MDTKKTHVLVSQPQMSSGNSQTTWQDRSARNVPLWKGVNTARLRELFSTRRLASRSPMLCGKTTLHRKLLRKKQICPIEDSHR